ncbi:hypothetical protein D9M71_746580 [compost metagenome]
MIQVIEQLRADTPRPLDKVRAAGAVHRQQAQGGEVAQHLAQLRVQVRPVEYGEVQAEIGALAPAPDHLGERRQGDARSA